MVTGFLAVPASALAEIVIDFGTTTGTNIKQYEEDGFRFDPIHNGVARRSIAITLTSLMREMAMYTSACMGGDGIESFNAEEVLLTSISGSAFDLLGLGAFAGEAGLWEMVSSSGGQYTFPAGLDIYTQAEYGLLFQNVTWVTFQSNTIPLTTADREFGFDQVNLQNVPEPGIALLLVSGAAALLCCRRRQRKRAA